MKTLVALFVFLYCLGIVRSSECESKEPHCYSRFDYEYKVLQRMVQLEESQKRLSEKLETVDNDDLKERLTQLEIGQLLINETLNTVKTDTSEELTTATGPIVVFSAYIDSTTTLQENTVFPEILINEQAAYDTTTGEFTCPVSGIYMFSVVIAVRGSGESWIRLKVNGGVIFNAVAEGSGSSSQDLQGGNMAIVKLNKGDRVWVSGSGSLPGNSGGNSNTRTSTFTGVLLHPTD